MPAVLEGTDRRTKVGTLVLDVLVSERIRLPSTVSKYPVEDGTEISDHIARGQEEISISGTVALADVVALESGAGEEAGTKLVDAVEALRKMHEERALITVSTGQMVYSDMALEGVEATRSAGDGGNWLSIQADLIKIRKVELKTAEVPEKAQGPAAGRTGQTNKNAGRNGAANGQGQGQNRTTGHGLLSRKDGLIMGEQPTSLRSAVSEQLSTLRGLR